MNANSQFCSICGASTVLENITIPISDTEELHTTERRCIICGCNERMAM